MEIPIRPKLYSFHEAFNAVGRKLLCDWTDEGIEEINEEPVVHRWKKFDLAKTI